MFLKKCRLTRLFLPALLIVSLCLASCGKQADSAESSGSSASSTDSSSSAGSTDDSSGSSVSDASESEKTDSEALTQGLIIEDGMAQPMLTYSDYLGEGYSNENSDILRFTVYVETDNDTDGDGLADLVKVFMQVPRAAVEGEYKAPVIYDPTPYNAGTADEYWGNAEELYEEKTFDYETLYKDCAKRTPSGEISTMDQALIEDSSEWNYSVPVTGVQGYEDGQHYDYYLVRGFAVAEASGIGTYGSEGFELCGFDLERDSHKCVVEWLAGNRKAYSDKKGTTEIKADWSNGKIAMTGTSYGGTLPFEVATTGVEGLETIIPYAGIASWYDYTNSQGISLHYDVNYADDLAAYNSGGVFTDEEWTDVDENYASWLYTVAQDEEETNGNYADIWSKTDYSKDYEKIRCSALIVHGLNDFNVTTRQSDLMYKAFKEAGMKVSLVLHQGDHEDLYGMKIDGAIWDETVNKWLCHYLLDVDNGIENMPEVTFQSNVDGSFTECSSWRDFDFEVMPVSYTDKETTVSTEGFADYVYGHMDISSDASLLNMPSANAAVYDIDIPEGTTIYGVPEISFTAYSDKVDFEGLMITAALVDTIDGETEFSAYTGETIAHTSVGSYDQGGDSWELALCDHEQAQTTAKAFTFGWTDLDNPETGENSWEYTSDYYRTAGEDYGYTFYMMPTVYTVAPGHKLKLVIYTWDPRTNADIDESYGSDDPDSIAFYNYSFTIKNDTVRADIPVLKEDRVVSSGS